MKWILQIYYHYLVVMEENVGICIIIILWTLLFRKGGEEVASAAEFPIFIAPLLAY